MAAKNIKKSPSDSHEPKAVGAIINEMLRSDSRFAAAYRRYKEAVDDEAEVETGQLFKNLFPDTHLCVDVKVFSIKPGRIPIDTFFEGYFTRNSEDKFLIIEKTRRRR